MRFRILVLAAGVVLALSAAVPAFATPGGKTFTIDSTVAATGCGTTGTTCGATCCVTFWTFTGRTNLASGLGSLRLSGSYSVGADPFQDPPVGLRDAAFTFTAGNGDQLVLVERATWVLTDPTPPQTWTVDQALSTGRFAGFSGSGTYSVTIGTSSDGTSATFAVALNGTLVSGP
jgi:hypothetical protein